MNAPSNNRPCRPRGALSWGAIAGVALAGLAVAAPLTAAERSAGGMRQPMGTGSPSPLRQPMDTGRPIPAPGPSGPSIPSRGEAGRDTDLRQLPPATGLISAPPGRPTAEDRVRRPDSASFTHRGTRYLVNDGHWYEQRGNDLVSVAAPAGVLVESLPDGYSVRWVSGVPYFYADGLYYVWRERSRRYEILQSAPGDERAPTGDRPRPDASRDPAP